MNSFLRKLAWLGRRPRKEADLQEELQFHLEEDAGERIGAGLDPSGARLAAQRVDSRLFDEIQRRLSLPSRAIPLGKRDDYAAPSRDA